ncbi:tetratricopeptide repeat protein [Alteromonas flava]|uniref:tetratricopeptide repeat protein n=1 Tax=Alteromonas flava TaxID=2048003 RepID=UPI000C293C12|nr:tetratricopeptide repeat protein [Alteromonas flava]
MSPAKKFVFSFIAVVGVPALFFGVLEGGLRLAGYGTHYQFFNEIEINGEPHLQDNKSFANQFYPPSLGVAPVNNTLTPTPGDDTVRVYVLGGSAAQGFPHVNHGLDRHLAAHLQAALPNKKIEIINTAMTSVNSHVVYEVARTLPANSADYAIVLMGNNEVVGPYGPSTFSQNFLSSLSLIRSLQALKRTRIWQAAEDLIQGVQEVSGDEELEWQGMQMFSGFSVPHDDPRLDAVYSHYESNLRDIVAMLQGKNMHVVVSSVPVNLRHSAPFGSAHRENMSTAESARWDQINTQASEAFTAQNWALAEQYYRELLSIDSEYADSHFQLAVALEKQGEYSAATEHYQAALHYDTKRFRTTPVMNDIVRKVGNDLVGDQFTFIDNVAVFDAASSPYAPGWDLLHEHVHFDYAGNYYLAREFTQAIVNDVAPDVEHTPLAKNQAAAMIGFPNHETIQVMNRLLGMVQKSPFTEQINFNDLVATTTARRDEVIAEVGSPAEVVARRKPLVESGMADWKIHYELAELNRFLRDNEASYFHLKELIEQYPHNHESYIKLAEYLSAKGELQQANRYLLSALNYVRQDETKVTQALGWIGLNYMKLNNYTEGQRYLDQVIDDYPDQISASIRAYGLLIKYAQEQQRMDDFRAYLAAVKRYAKMLIATERVNEFPLLYRRMAQIMTMAGDTVEAQRWQSMQSD